MFSASRPLFSSPPPLRGRSTAEGGREGGVFSITAQTPLPNPPPTKGRSRPSSTGYGGRERACASGEVELQTWLLRRPQLRLHLVEQRLDLGLVKPRDVVLIFQQRAERVRHRRRIERHHVELGERAGPVERLGNAGHLEQVLLA